MIEAARSFLAAIGAAQSINDFRAIHDVDKSRPAIPLRGTLDQCWEALDHYNREGYGIFVTINELDGAGREISNVKTIRAQFIDKDNDTGWQTWQALGVWDIPPTCYVVTRPGRFHAYWATEHHGDRDRFSVIQSKLIARWASDPVVKDAPRVMRLPGTLNMKDPANPSPVQFVPGTGRSVTTGQLEWALASVPVDISAPDVHALGDPKLAAPSLEWATYALSKIDPNQLDRGEWLKLTAAFKASAWSAGEPVVRMIWDQWSAQYKKNDVAENDKLWRSIRDTKTGWPYLMRASGVTPELMFGQPATGEVVTTPILNQGSGYLTPTEQIEWFNGCVLIENMGRILTPSGRFMDSSKFNAAYGGKVFALSADGAKNTDEPWKAATRGQVFQVPKVDHIRFLPNAEPGTIVNDELGRRGINVYRPPVIEAMHGDASPFVSHLRALMPTESDLAILLSFLAHCVQRPGVKALWAPVIQSAEGAGKGIVLEAMQHALGAPYVYAVNARELGEGGGKFNAWMRNKLMIIANEIRTDDRRDMMEVLKPMITEYRIEIQGKGVDQDMEDNPSNWLMFTNWKDAIPITRDSRRYAIFYSPLQTVGDIQRVGMGGEYFPRLYAWLRAEGHKYVTWFLREYPIEAKYDPTKEAHRAPITTSTAEAIIASLGRVEQSILEAIDGGEPGFRNGWVSSAAISKMLKAEGLKVGPHAIGRALDTLGYRFIGRAGRQIFEEDMKQPNLYSKLSGVVVSEYITAQGYQSKP